MFSAGQLVTVPFPFAEKEKSKPRPVVLISSPDAYGDFICLAVTSRERESDAVPLHPADMTEGALPLASWIRTDKIFTLNASLAIKVLGTVNAEVIGRALAQLCEKVGHHR